MTAQTITIAGARGGSGTTTIAAATALLLAGHAATELVAAERDTTAALLGLTGLHDGCAPIKVAEHLTLVSTPFGTAEMAVVDAQRLDQLEARPGGLFVVVLRGPCYLGLRTMTTCGVPADGIVLLMEPGRSLTRRDVSDVCDVPVIAEIAVTANVARAMDAGLLVSRVHRLLEFNGLRRHLNSLVTPHDNDTPTPNTTVSYLHTSRPKTAFTSVTDLPVPLSGTS
jgi:hypothetical protein